METFYLVDFENVHNEGIENIDNLTKEDHVHIFSTQNALNIRTDIFWLDGDIQSHLVPMRKQSLDMHLVSYLGYLLGIHSKQCAYVIVSKDTDYDNIIKFWKEEGYQNISRKQNITSFKPHKKGDSTATINADSINAHNKINDKAAHKLSGNDRCKLNTFLQHELIDIGYSGKDANRICKYIIGHCNDERMLSEIHNDIRLNFENYEDIYKDAKAVLKKYFSEENSKDTKREAQARSFFGQHFKEKIYVEHKDEIIEIILNGQTRQSINNSLLKLYSDGNVVKRIYQVIQPLIKELPGK